MPSFLTHLSVEECLSRAKYMPIDSFVGEKDKENKRYRVKIIRKKKQFVLRTNSNYTYGGVSDLKIKDAVFRISEHASGSKIDVKFRYKRALLVYCFLLPAFFVISYAIIALTTPITRSPPYQVLWVLVPFCILAALSFLQRSPAFKANDTIIFNAIKAMLEAEEVPKEGRK
jgi:hypothetical protein